MVIAINKKHQRTVNKFIRWDEAYAEEVDKNAELGKDTSRAQEKAYEKALDSWEELPKREQQNISKHIDTTGY